MKKEFVSFVNIDKKEVLRYLEYKGQEIDDNLHTIINECIELTKQRINSRYIWRVYPLDIDKENESISISGIKLKLESKDLYRHIKECKKCVIIATTLGMEIEQLIRKYSYLNLTKSIILDACATTAVEQVCDDIELRIKEEILEENEFLTSRYSPGYGDLSIETNREIIELLSLQREIGLTVTQETIMIPRKSVIAIIGITENSENKIRKRCSACNLRKECKYRKGDGYCGN